MPEQPIYPLFPYTTLFRSDLATSAPDRVAVRVIAKVARSLAVDSSGRAQTTPVDDAWAIRDRKSTRLNSSHRCISYAVFCLKKKTLASGTTHRQPEFGPTQ